MLITTHKADRSTILSIPDMLDEIAWLLDLPDITQNELDCLFEMIIYVADHR